MKVTSIAGIAGLLTLALGTGCASGVYVRPPPSAAPVSAPGAAPRASASMVVLTREQVAAVRLHFEGNGRSNGRGGGLPPGIARNLERGKPLPPGIARQYLPNELVVTLPRLDRGLEYVVAAGKLLLVEAATQVVRDVLIDVLYD